MAAISSEEVQFREKIAEFIGTVKATRKSTEDALKRIESDESSCKKEVNGALQEIRNELWKIQEHLNRVDLTIAVARAKALAYGGAAGLIVSALVYLGKVLLKTYILN